MSISVSALEVGACTPDPCPEGYSAGPVTCSSGVCTVLCGNVTGCSGSYTTIHTDSEYLPNLDIPSGYDSWAATLELGSYVVQDATKCYRFRQTTPDEFVDNSDIDGYQFLGEFDSGISLSWGDTELDSRWFDNQQYYSDGENTPFLWYDGGVWIDSCFDDGNNFLSADSFGNTNSLYCAPNSDACDDLNLGNCDTDCYGLPTELNLRLVADDLGDDSTCNSFSDFDNNNDGNYGGVIDYVNFDTQTVYMYVDEYDGILADNFTSECNYWPECNPADPCCDSEGYLRSNGYVCNSAHDTTCSSAASCSGSAYEDRCDGTNSYCPDNNYAIDYPEACDDLTCVSESCTGETYQPKRTCSAGTCQANDVYACPNNLNCEDSVSCKLSPTSASDCASGYSFNSEYGVCFLDNGQSYIGLIYDNNGNLISDSTFNYSYDGFNQLVEIMYPDGTVLEEYFYDGQGSRVKKIEYGSSENTTTYYFENFVQTVNSSGVFNETYYSYAGRILAKKDNGGNIFFYHPDHMGSIALITNGAGAKVGDTSYQPYGQPLVGSPNEGFLYEGKEYDDELSKYFYNSRYYDPSLKIFTQPDTLLPDTYDPQQLNMYAFERGNPNRYVDIDGNYVESIIDLAFIGADIYSIYDDPTNWVNYAALGGDLVGLAVPFATGVGSGVKAGVKGIRATDKSSDVAKGAREVSTNAWGVSDEVAEVFKKGGGVEEFIEFEGRRVYGNKNLNFNLIDKSTVKTVGKEFDLHHISQGVDSSDLIFLQKDVHSYYSKTIHLGNPSNINRNAFKKFKNKFWKLFY